MFFMVAKLAGKGPKIVFVERIACCLLAGLRRL